MPVHSCICQGVRVVVCCTVYVYHIFLLFAYTYVCACACVYVCVHVCACMCSCEWLGTQQSIKSFWRGRRQGTPNVSATMVASSYGIRRYVWRPPTAYSESERERDHAITSTDSALDNARCVWVCNKAPPGVKIRLKAQYSNKQAEHTITHGPMVGGGKKKKWKMNNKTNGIAAHCRRVSDAIRSENVNSIICLLYIVYQHFYSQIMRFTINDNYDVRKTERR